MQAKHATFVLSEPERKPGAYRVHSSCGTIELLPLSTPLSNKAAPGSFPKIGAWAALSDTFVPFCSELGNAMIPTNRPVLGRDLDELKQLFGLSSPDTCYLLGISISKWSELIGKGADKPIEDPTLALLARILDLHPGLISLPQYPDVQDMFELFKKVNPSIDQKRFSILMGGEASSGHRWLKSRPRMTATMPRLMLYLQRMIESSPDGGWKELKTWSEIVRLEGNARGVEDVFKAGRWTVSERMLKAANDDSSGEEQSNRKAKTSTEAKSAQTEAGTTKKVAAKKAAKTSEVKATAKGTASAKATPRPKKS